MLDARAYQRKGGSCPFDERFERVGDPRAAARIDTAVRKLARGLRPDVRSVGEGVQESRIDYGPGYRVYFGFDGTELIVLLLRGDRRTQGDDIAFAKVLWTEYRTRKARLPSKATPNNKRVGRHTSLYVMVRLVRATYFSICRDSWPGLRRAMTMGRATT
jgi:putative addiction module killer protein